jgi:hypothetical protein
MLTEEGLVAETGIDAAALKPAECDVSRAGELPVDTVAIDYEGREHVPDGETLEALVDEVEVRLTIPVRADGFDPLGDDARDAAVPEGVKRVLVAGHSAYLEDHARGRAPPPRLGAAAEQYPDAWVGTESVERVAMATGRTQFELLSRATERDLRALRAAGHDGEIAVYAPTVLSGDDDAVLDTVGGYVARRDPVAEALPADAAADAAASRRAREVLLAAADDYALVGTASTVRERVAELKDAGADLVVAYPARGLRAFLRQ